MAANQARRAIQFSSASAKTLFRNTTSEARSSPFATTKPANLSGLSPSRLSFQNFALSRLPVELGAVLSMMPLHSVTASAVFTSLLSLHNDKWGHLSEGFATPL